MATRDDGSRRKRRREPEPEAFNRSSNSESTTHGDSEPKEPINVSVTRLGPGPYVTFLVGNEVREVSQDRLFSHIWRHGLDSNCMVCGESFVPGVSVPIRTIGFEQSLPARPSIVDITQTALAPHPVRIYNRHLSCIKAKKIDFIPVSHAWHPDIASAQDDEVENINAARIAYQIPVKTLLAATKKYGPVEIWHDYLSVPQWQKETQRQLLLSIPAIYGFPQSIIMHLDDVRSEHLTHTYEDDSYQSFIDGLASTLQSRWFNRMWVTLEYIRGKEVIMLSEDYEISDFSASHLSLRISNVAAKYIKRSGHGKFMENIYEQGSKWATNVSWTDMESWKSRVDKHRTFGAAIYILGMKQCRDPQDYYFALGGMIGFSPEAVETEGFGCDGFAYFFHLAVHALRSGDYTPLLLNPLRGERPDPRASWLRGYSQMSEKSWDLGVCHRRARSLEIIRNGVIQPELESVGVIEWFEHTGFEKECEDVFIDVAIQILRSSGSCPTAFIAALDRIFTRTERKALYTEWESTKVTTTKKPSAPQPTSQPLPAIEELLDEFSTLVYSLNNHDSLASNPQILSLAKKMITLLQLDRPGKQAADSRMSITHAEAKWYRERYGKEMEGLGRIRCKFCGRRALFRLTAWGNPELEATQVYRIPELLFDESVPDGVGLVVCRETVIGKMIYGTPYCDCCRSEKVYLGSATLRMGC